MESRVIRVPLDVLNALNEKCLEDGDDCKWNTMRQLLEIDVIKKRVPRPSPPRRGRFKYDVTDLAVGESKTFVDVHPELVVPAVNRYGRTRGKRFVCHGAPGQVTVTRMR